MATMTMTIHEIEEHDSDLPEEIEVPEEDPQVNFYPPLYLQRRIWILDILRRESVVEVLDVGCGEGTLLSVLAQPSSWLPPPAASMFPHAVDDALVSYTTEVINLHPQRIMGLDVSAADLAFAVKDTKPPNDEENDQECPNPYAVRVTRWEELNIKIWNGGLQTVNEEFVGLECIVCTEVVEHLPPDVFPALAPLLLGVYHPKRLLVTTPSYTFNARFTRPGAPRAARARQGFPDPTQRTDRIFRHSDHKFEWTVEEFRAWCRESAEAWGYAIEELGGVGRPLEDDPWGRDDELGDASLVACFLRKEDGRTAARAEQARAVLQSLKLDGEPHRLLAEHVHKAHEMARREPKPESVRAIGDLVKAKMEEFRETIIPLEQAWFHYDVAALCGGWIEVFIWALDAYDRLNILRPNETSKDWSIELVGRVQEARPTWPDVANRSLDLIPDNWMPGQDPGDFSDEDAEDDAPSTVSSTGADGDVSWEDSDFGDTTAEDDGAWGKSEGWGS